MATEDSWIFVTNEKDINIVIENSKILQDRPSFKEKEEEQHKSKNGRGTGGKCNTNMSKK